MNVTKELNLSFCTEKKEEALLLPEVSIKFESKVDFI